jgi:hypothetical protein
MPQIFKRTSWRKAKNAIGFTRLRRDFGVAGIAIDPRNTAVIESDMSVGYCGHAGIFYLMINKAELVTRLWWMRRLIRTCGLKTVTIH